MRCDAIILGTCEDAGRTAPKVCGRGAEGLMAFGMFWKSAEKVEEIKMKRVIVTHRSKLHRETGQSTHAEGGHPALPIEGWGGAAPVDWWDSTQHDFEPVEHKSHSH